MSDLWQSKKDNSPEVQGGWRKPAKTDSGEGWQSSQAREEEEKRQEASSGWRKPEMPASETPKQEGAWHLPKSEETTYEAQPIEPAAEEEAETPVVEEPVAQTEEATEEEVLPFDDHQASSTGDDSDDVDGLEAIADSVDLDTLDEDEDADTFSMSELVALAGLVEEDEEEASPASAEATTDDAVDPAEYARRQLEALNGQAEEESAPVASAVDADDPAEYARQQLAKLAEGEPTSTGEVEVAPAEPTPELTIDPEIEAQGRLFLEAEERIKSLREQYRAGQLTREDFQSRLRQQMVRDDDGSFWMMGVESDNWYHFENGQWVLATPSELEAVKAYDAGVASAPKTSSEAFEEGNTLVSQPVTSNVDEDMPLPRQVPVRDLDATIPGTQAIYFDDQAQPTVPMQAITDDQLTVPTAAVQETIPSVIANQAVAVPAVPAVPPAEVVHAPAYETSKEVAPTSTYQEALNRQRRKNTRNIGLGCVALIGALFLMMAVVVVGAILYYQNIAGPYANAIAGLANYQPEFNTARIRAADGTVIAELLGQNAGARDVIPLGEISPEMIHALISVENERFYDDPGYDVIAITRAVLQNLSAGQIQSGASTLTQQLARALILEDNTVSPDRKIREIIVAAEIARMYDKNFILELYLNEMFFGNMSYGVEAASQFYFGHSASELNIPEAAMLAGILQSPVAYDPITNRQASIDRMRFVMQRMVATGCVQMQHAPYLGQEFCVTDQNIRDAVVQIAQVEARTYTRRSFEAQYPHFVLEVLRQIEQVYGTNEIYRRGFQVTTTLNPAIQNSAQQLLNQTLSGITNTGVDTGAVLVTNPQDGAILAWIGSPDFYNDEIDGQFDNIFSYQQPGSSIKPIIYTAALEGVDRNGLHEYMNPATIIWDVPTTYGGTPAYAPTNYDNLFHGPVSFRSALQNSYNVPTVKVLDFIGINRFIETAQRLGLTFASNADFNLTSALGSNEITLYDQVTAYGAFANGGYFIEPYAITSIQDAQGNEVELPPRVEPLQVIQPQIAYLMQSILTDNDSRIPAFGANSGLYLPEYPGMVGAKTGTTNDNRDLWTMGFTNNTVVGVWMGTVDNTQTNANTSISAVPVWNGVMRAALQNRAPAFFNIPQGVVSADVCSLTGTMYDPNTPACGNVRTEIFIQTDPPLNAGQSWLQNVAVDSWTGLLANQYCNANVVNVPVVNISDPTAVTWLNGAGSYLAQQLNIPLPVQSAPSAQCQADYTSPTVTIMNPTEGQTISGVVTITGAATGSNFERYEIHLARASDPNGFILISGPSNVQQTNANLGSWDTRGYGDGDYILRLAMFSQSGGSLYTSVNVRVTNAAVQPPPVIQPTSPAILPPTTTPIPVGP